jgi:hypothetical protein
MGPVGRVPTWLGCLAAIGGFIFAGFQLRQLNIQLELQARQLEHVQEEARRERTIETKGVCVSWSGPKRGAPDSEGSFAWALTFMAL